MKQINLLPTGVAFLDDDDYEKYSKYKWYLSANGYVIFGDAKDGIKSFAKMHRLITGASPGEIVDHINGVKTDNRRENLRIATMEQNIHNQKKRSNTKNKYKGVQYKQKLRAFEARCRMYKKDFHLGIYTSEIAAAYAYNKKALELSEFAFINALPYSDEVLEEMLISCRIQKTKARFTSKYKYVMFAKAHNKFHKDRWVFAIKSKLGKDNNNGREIYRGGFKTEEDAFACLIDNYRHIFPDNYNFLRKAS